VQKKKPKKPQPAIAIPPPRGTGLKLAQFRGKTADLATLRLLVRLYACTCSQGTYHMSHRRASRFAAADYVRLPMFTTVA